MAKSTKLLQRARAQMARVREKEKQTTVLAIEKAAGLGTSIGLAMLSDKIPVSVMGIPTKLAISAAAYVGAVMTKGNFQKGLESIGDASSHVYAYLAALKVKQGESKPWVAGDDDDSIVDV
jgi:hypothetical protein